MNSDSVMTDEFLLTAIHNLRAYLRRSYANAQLLQRAASGALEQQASNLLDSVLLANHELDIFLTRLADFANASELGRGRALPVRAAIEAALLHFPSQPVSFSGTAEGSGGAGDLPVPQECVRIFQELIDNALKFSNAAPVSVQIRYLAEPGKDVVVDICDGGIGIVAGDEEAIFEALNRRVARPQFPGYGLGLAICRRIATTAGFTVRLANGPAGGAIASVTFPDSVTNLPNVH